MKMQAHTESRRESLVLAALRFGLLGGAVAVFLCLVGMVETFGKRFLIENVLSLGHFVLVATFLGMGYAAAAKISGSSPKPSPLAYPATGALVGAILGAILSFLVLVGSEIDLRAVFLTASPGLYDMLTLGGGLTSAWVPVGIGASLGLVGSSFFLVPALLRGPIMKGLVVVVLVGLFTGLLGVIMINQGGSVARLEKLLYGNTGITLEGALVVFAAVVALSLLWHARGSSIRNGYSRLPRSARRVGRVLALALLLLVVVRLPEVSGLFVSQVIVFISLYTLMGLGLNITLGFAGLLDLGFVAFFAIGAYTVGLLTSYGQYGLQHVSFWAAVPIAVLVAMAAGFVLGLPVLGVRGDYLAIATLGFGEIVRILAGSDFLAQWFGGPQGIIGIQKPCLGVLEPFLKVDVPRICDGLQLGTPKEIYFIAVLSAALVAFVATRLRSSRLGRAWMAIREDEDVAEALGINLIQTKLLAYMLGAAFAGLGGAIFATLVGSIFASSMQLLVSINVVALIIVGGMGSIPGVIVGAIALVGIPELLREVSEFRFLFYGAVLIIMMLSKPEGLWPSKTIQREFHHDEAAAAPAGGGAGA